jgi:hypothetical protein
VIPLELWIEQQPSSEASVVALGEEKQQDQFVLDSITEGRMWSRTWQGMDNRLTA